MADYITIDNDLRQITFPESLQVLGVEHDKETHKLLFEMPATFGDFDLSEFSFYINYRNPLGEIAKYEISDISTKKELINGVVTSKLTFSWLVGEEAFRAAGIGQFVVCLKLYDDNNVVLQEFNTELTNLPPVLEGLELPNDGEEYFIIDNDLRHIKIPESMQVLGVENDSSVHRLYFKMPRYYTDTDLWDNTFIYINYKNANDILDREIIDDAVLSADGQSILFSWLVGRTAFEKAGIVKFVVCIQKVDEGSLPNIVIQQDPSVEIIAEYHTETTCLPPVLEGLEVNNFTSSPYYDIITSYLAIVQYLKECYDELMPYVESGLIITPRVSRRYFGTCSTAADTEIKNVIIDDESFVHEQGVYLDVWFEHENTNRFAKLGIQVAHPENEPEPEPDEPDPEEGTNDDCNDPDGAPWADESSNNIWNIKHDTNSASIKISQISELFNRTPVLETNTNDADISLATTYTYSDIITKSISFINSEHPNTGTDQNDSLPYRWEAGEFVTFRLWDDVWVMEQDFQHGYESDTQAPHSVALGHGTIAQSYGSTIIGEYNDISGESIGSRDNFGDTKGKTNRVGANYAFAIGNGTSSSNRSNAMTVNWNGDETISGSMYIDADLLWGCASEDGAQSGEALTKMVNELGDDLTKEKMTSVHYWEWSDTDSDYDTHGPIGSSTNPIYINDSGIATASDSTVGSSTKPIYLSSGTLTASNSTVGGSAKPIYLSSGTLTAFSSTIGSNSKPVYVSSGTITVGNYDFTNYSTTEEMNQAIHDAGHLTYVCVDELPDVKDAEENTVYAVPDPSAGVDENDIPNSRLEYILVNGQWEVWGTTSVDLSTYINQDQINAVNTYGDLKGKRILVWDDTSGFTPPTISDLEAYLKAYLADYLMKD